MTAAKAEGRFVFNRACLKEIENLRETGLALEERGSEIVEGTRIATSQFKHPTGAYERSLYASREHGSRGWVGYANAEVPYAWFLEYGTENGTPEYAPMRKAAEAIGRVKGRR